MNARRFLTKAMAITLIFVTTVRSGWSADAVPQLPKPDEITELAKLVKAIGEKPEITLAGRAAVEKEYRKTVNQFDTVWKPMETAYREVITTTREYEGKLAEHNEVVFQHNKARPDSRNEAAVRAYNEEADRLDAAGEELTSERDAVLSMLVDTMYERADEVDAFLASPGFKNTMKMFQGIWMNESEALRQLRKIADGEDGRFDGSPFNNR